MNPHKCPKCGGQLFEVRYDPNSMLNRDQFESIRAGDWYCTTCKSDKAKSEYEYFWERELAGKPEVGRMSNFSMPGPLPYNVVGQRPVNNECPVCHTFAEPYVRETYYILDECVAQPDGTLARCKQIDVPAGPSERITRCKSCNAAFWQDAVRAR